MSLIQWNFYSQYLRCSTNVNVILPDIPREENTENFYRSGKKYPVLWLLHGLTGDYSNWVRMTSIERYACEKQLAVVMPSASNSEYSAWPSAMSMPYDFPGYFIKELMPMVYGWLPISEGREDNFIGGLSMGGGAIRLAAYYPERFAGCAVLSSCAWDMDFLEEFRSLSAEDFRRKMALPAYKGFLWGHGVPEPYLASICKYATVGDFLDSYDNTRRNIRKAVRKGIMPRTYNAIGTLDEGYEKFLNYQSFCQELGADMKFEIYEGYGHVWPLWDMTIQRAIEYFGF